MVDLHAHVVPFIDDGSVSLDDSLEMLKVAQSQGVTDMVLTPHLNRVYELPVVKVKQAFEQFKNQAKNSGCDMNLYLGQEIFVDSSFNKVFSRNDILTINNTDFALVEFDFQEEFDIAETVYQMKRQGLKAIIAHFERYSYTDISVANEVKSLGGYIQVNAESCTGGIFGKSKIKKLFSQNLVDFVASDVHVFRKYKMQKAKEWIEKRYGESVANAVLKENALKILKG